MTQIPDGWYQDPDSPDRLRFWQNNNWTPHWAVPAANGRIGTRTPLATKVSLVIVAVGAFGYLAWTFLSFALLIDGPDAFVFVYLVAALGGFIVYGVALVIAVVGYRQAKAEAKVPPTSIAALVLSAVPFAIFTLSLFGVPIVSALVKS